MPIDLEAWLRIATAAADAYDDPDFRAGHGTEEQRSAKAKFHHTFTPEVIIGLLRYILRLPERPTP